MDKDNTLKYLTKLVECVEHYSKDYFPQITGFTNKLKEEILNGEYDNIAKEVEKKYNKNNISNKSRLGIMTTQLLLDLFHDGVNKNIKVNREQVNNLEECHICMENMSNVRTSCNHMLCLLCCEKIKHTFQDDIVKCPFCRQNITSFTVLN